MDLDLKTYILAFLIGVALYILVNRVLMVEGVTDNDDRIMTLEECQTIDARCGNDFLCLDKAAKPNPVCAAISNMDVCLGKGMSETFVWCDNSLPPSTPSSTPSPSSTPLPDDDKFKQIIKESVYEPSWLEDLYKKIKGELWWLQHAPTPFSPLNDVYKSTLLLLNMKYKEFQDFLNLLDRNTETKFMDLVNDTHGLIIMIYLDDLDPDDYDYEIDLSYILKIANCFNGDIKLLRVHGENWSRCCGGWSDFMLDLLYNKLLQTTGSSGFLLTVGDKISSIGNIVLDLPNLEYLDLSYNNIRGNLKEFPILPQLLSLNLSGNDNIRGELNEFPNLPQLLSLNLSGTNTKIIGYLKKFPILRQLKHLDLSGDPDKTYINTISGNLNKFRNLFLNLLTLPNLEHLDLSNNNIRGNLKDFPILPNLLSLNLSRNDNISGELKEFPILPKLLSLNLSSYPRTNTKISGNLYDLPILRQLEYLDLSLTGISGNLSDLPNLPKLEYLNLSLTGISGNLKEFSNLPNLEYLNLDWTDISGNLNEFPNLQNLEYLNLSNTDNTKISGNLNGLSNLSKLKYLYICENRYNDLGNHNIAGDISKVENIKQIYDEASSQSTDLDLCPSVIGKHPFSCRADCLLPAELASFGSRKIGGGQCEYYDFSVSDTAKQLKIYNPADCEEQVESECNLECVWGRWPPL